MEKRGNADVPLYPAKEWIAESTRNAHAYLKSQIKPTLAYLNRDIVTDQVQGLDGNGI